MTYKNANKTLLASLQSQLHGVVTVAIAWRRLDLVLKWRKHVTPGKSLIYVGRPTTHTTHGGAYPRSQDALVNSDRSSYSDDVLLQIRSQYFLLPLVDLFTHPSAIGSQELL